MICKLLITIAVIFTTINSYALELKSTATFSAKEIDSKEEAVKFTSINYRAETYEKKDGESTTYKKIILSEAKTFTMMLDALNYKIITTAYLGDTYSTAKKVWTITIPEASETEIKDSMYLAKIPGCCSLEDVTYYYNLGTGKKVFATSSKPVSIGETQEENSTNRLIGYLSSQNTATSDGENSPKGLIGTITLNSNTKTKESIQVYYNGDYDPTDGSPAISVIYQGKEHKDHTQIYDKQPISNMIVLFKFENKTTIEIPLTNDSFDLSKAKHPKIITLKKLKK